MSSGAPTSARSAADAHPDQRGPRRGPGAQRAVAALIRWGPYLIALAVYAAVAVVTTWPMPSDPTGTVFGAPGDMTGNITLLRYRNELGVGPLSSAITPQENAPFGLSLPGAVSLPQVMIEGPAQLLAAITGNAVFAANMVVLSGLCLTAFACFALCMSITGSAWASGVAGLGYGFNPWIVERAHGHIHFTHLWALPLIVMALMWVRRGGGRRAWAALALAMIAGCYTHTYISLFVAVTVGAFIVADLCAAVLRRNVPRARDAFSRGCFAFALLVAVMLPQAIVSRTQADEIDGLLAGSRSPQDLWTYGSRWWEWITPSHRNPVFDEWTAPFLAARQHSSSFGETTLYLGSVTLALAVAGVAVTLLARRRGVPAWAGGMGMSLVVMGLWVSLPKTISPLGVEIPTPSWLLSQLVEPWRVYARLFAVVSLGVAVLAAIGLARFLRPLPRIGASAVALALGTLVVLDLNISSTSFSAEPTPVYRALAAASGDEPRVEYPLTPPVQAAHLVYIFYTEAAGRPLVNGGRRATTGGSFDGRLQDPTSPWSARTLAGLGARWVVLHSHIYGGPPPTLEDGYRLVGDFEGSFLYEVTAAAPSVIAVPGDGFGPPEPQLGGQGRFAQWMEGATGSIAVINTTDRPRATTVRFSAGSFYRDRNVKVVHNGATVADAPVSRSRATPFEFTVVVPPGETNLEVIASPGADRIGSVLGNDDQRSVTVQFTGISVTTPGEAAIRVG